MRELNRQEENSDNMRYSYLDHPSMDLLERFVLNRSSEEETELVETHMLACESCVCRAEDLESEIAAMKLALQNFTEQQRAAAQAETVKPASWKKWFSIPVFSWAGAGLAACAFCLFAFLPANVELKAERGATSIVVPEWRKTHLVLQDEGIQAGPLQAEVVNQIGSLVWAGTVKSVNGQVTLTLPRIQHAGNYYAHLYTPGPEHEMLSEFPFEVKFQF